MGAKDDVSLGPHRRDAVALGKGRAHT